MSKIDAAINLKDGMANIPSRLIDSMSSKLHNIKLSKSNKNSKSKKYYGIIIMPSSVGIQKCDIIQNNNSDLMITTKKPNKKTIESTITSLFAIDGSYKLSTMGKNIDIKNKGEEIARDSSLSPGQKIDEINKLKEKLQQPLPSLEITNMGKLYNKLLEQGAMKTDKIKNDLIIYCITLKVMEDSEQTLEECTLSTPDEALASVNNFGFNPFSITKTKTLPQGSFMVVEDVGETNIYSESGQSDIFDINLGKLSLILV